MGSTLGRSHPVAGSDHDLHRQIGLRHGDSADFDGGSNGHGREDMKRRAFAVRGLYRVEHGAQATAKLRGVSLEFQYVLMRMFDLDRLKREIGTKHAPHAIIDDCRAHARTSAGGRFGCPNE